MNAFFRSPVLDGACIFDGWVYLKAETPSGERLIFRSPIHPSGCIFTDPSLIQVKRAGGWNQLRDEDEEIIALIMAITGSMYGRAA